MGSGIGGHAHIDAEVFAALLTLLTYSVKWIFGLAFSQFILLVPTFVAVFIGYYVILYAFFLIVWSRK